MKIIIAGFGKMGHELANIATDRGHSIVAIFNNEEDWKNNSIPDCDVVIDFSTPASAPEIVNFCFDNNIPVISGTTGWTDRVSLAMERARIEGKTFFYASNFSIGVNIFSEINKKLASFLCTLNEYHVNIHEVHHIHKKDAPSGTAITLANEIIASCNRYKDWNIDGEESEKINISSERIGEIPGTHIIEWNSPNDSIQLIHTAHNRKGFALGAIIAAEWLNGKKGVFSMKDLLFD